MKTIKLFTDTETTGLLGQAEQILTYSVVLEKPKSVVEEAAEFKIFLKSYLLPNPSALLVNNLNPLTEEFKDNAKHEFEAYEHLKSISEKYTKEDYRVLVIAYNALYDKDMYGHMFSRCGDKLEKSFRMWWDPLPTARKLIEEGAILTEEVRTAFKTYRTAKLEAVYKALGFEMEFKAHSALDDTKMLQIVAHSVYFMAVGKALEDLGTCPRSYTEGEIKTLIFDDSKIGLHLKLVKVIKNDKEKEQLIVLEAETAYNENSTEKAVKVIPYELILDEKETEEREVNRLNSFYDSNQISYESQVDEILNQKEKKPTKETSFEDVLSLVNKIDDSKDKIKTYEGLSEDEKKMYKMAEDYSLAKTGRGWSREIFGINHLSALRIVDISPFILKLDPIGKFLLYKGEDLIIETDKRTQLQEAILKDLEIEKESEQYKLINKKIPFTKDFQNPKHPRTILEEYERMKGDVFNGTNKAHKDLFTDLLAHFKQESPEVFGDVKLPSFNLNLQSFLKKK